MNKKITTIFTDIGGVLLTNGWDRYGRAGAVKLFGLDAAETEDRHKLTYDTFESGKLSLDTYLERVVFYEPRNFDKQDFINYMYTCSQPHEDMLQLIRQLKEKHRLKIAVVSNEGREINAYRIQKFKLNEFVDFFISSSFVHFRKPDVDIFKVALDVAQVHTSEIIYLEDRPLFAQVAESLDIKSIIHSNYETTKMELEKLGLGL